MVQELTGQQIHVMFVSLNNVGMESYFMLTLLVLLSLAVGSFLSVVSYRIPRGLGFIGGRSFCDRCKKSLFWYDNIPIFSYLLYEGQSRCCSSPISIRYPLVEIASVVGAITLFLIFGLNKFWIYYLLYCLCLVVFIIDLEFQIIPDIFIWIIVSLAIIFSPYPFFSIMFSAFLCSLLLECLHLITNGRGMGMGDVKLVIGLGMWLPLIWGMKWLMTSFILGGIVASILLVLKKANLKTKIAFGPFLIIGFWVILFVYKFS